MPTKLAKIEVNPKPVYISFLLLAPGCAGQPHVSPIPALVIVMSADYKYAYNAIKTGND